MAKRASDEELIASYRELLSANQVARRHGVNQKTVYNALARAGISAQGLEHYRKHAARYPEDVQREIRRLYESGVRGPALRREFGGSESSIKQAILRAGGQMKPPPGHPSQLTPDQQSEICAKYQAGMSLVDLAHVYKAGALTVRTVLIQHGVELRRQRRNPAKYRYIGTNGYVWVRVPSNDPLAPMAGSKGSIQEHRPSWLDTWVVSCHLTNRSITLTATKQTTGSRTCSYVGTSTARVFVSCVSTAALGTSVTRLSKEVPHD